MPSKPPHVRCALQWIRIGRIHENALASSHPSCGTWRARRTGNFFLEVHMNTAIVLWGGGKRRSWERETLLIAATAGIATAIGAAIGGKKGATFGAVSGGATRFLMRLLSW